jgi:hypothetical protein
MLLLITIAWMNDPAPLTDLLENDGFPDEPKLMRTTDIGRLC